MCVLHHLVTSSKTAEAPSPEEPDFARQIQALKTVLGRPEAKTERWLGTMLGWCSELVQSLRDYAESLKLGKSSSTPMLRGGARWRSSR